MFASLWSTFPQPWSGQVDTWTSECGRTRRPWPGAGPQVHQPPARHQPWIQLWICWRPTREHDYCPCPISCTTVHFIFLFNDYLATDLECVQVVMARMIIRVHIISGVLFTSTMCQQEQSGVLWCWLLLCCDCNDCNSAANRSIGSTTGCTITKKPLLPLSHLRHY